MKLSLVTALLAQAVVVVSTSWKTQYCLYKEATLASGYSCTCGGGGTKPGNQYFERLCKPIIADEDWVFPGCASDTGTIYCCQKTYF
ncbi:predicted protein [Plenodomus lingam JN3]|uniref:Predicted protein n=1 Tax=Leptosphaeria maculans (strain JN3 / isolate v23.1.3 / race Av1-4-5-6-7-8) TaxID=985895 RepID=E4ZSK4_LEPMJ|nr:predicted protein [Plenodomus lingam JN3]CBX94384.1 predicted protein [Plenodomus lingam JN3]